jgi:hypothetical protein
VSIFEILMLLCFGAAWPISVKKSYTSRTNKGKSLFFLFILEIGYIAGITHKILYSFDLVIILYMLNFVMVFTDIMMYYRNYRISLQQS